MGRAFLKVFFDFEERTERLSETERGRLLLGMLHYASTGEEPELSGNEQFLWPVFRGEIDREVEAYETRVANGCKGGRPPKKAPEAETEGTEAEPEETEQNRNKPNKTEINRNAQEQEQEQEQRKTDDDDDIRARARDAEVVTAFRESLGRAPAPEEVQQISAAAGMLGMEKGVAGHAVQLAAMHGARSPTAYVKKLMQEWSYDGKRSLEDVISGEIEEDQKRGKVILPRIRRALAFGQEA